jgi:hypothetical protein
MRLSFEKKTLLHRTAYSLCVAYEHLNTMPVAEVSEYLQGDVLIAALAHVTGFEEAEIYNEAIKQANKRERQNGINTD